MKVKITKEAKEYISLADAPLVRNLIMEAKEYYDEEDIARLAAGVAGMHDDYQLLKFEAEIVKNSRAQCDLSPCSKQYDIYVNIYIFNSFYGFYWIGAYVTDLWKYTGTNAEEIRPYMFIRKYINE